MGKANISFPAGMLELIDERAEGAGTTRSGLVQEAVATYFARLDHAAERQRRTARIEDALAGMREIGRTLQPGPPGVRLIRESRDAAPGWLVDKSHGDDE